MRTELQLYKNDIKAFVESTRHIKIIYSFRLDEYELEFQPNQRGDGKIFGLLIDDGVHLILGHMDTEEVLQSIKSFEENPKEFWKQKYNKCKIVVL